MIETDYLSRHWTAVMCVSSTMVVIALIFSLAFGAVDIPITSLLNWAMGRADAQTHTILMSLRLPRAILTAGVGAVLAVAGAATQGLFRNPLADPSLIGVSAGAAAGASCVIVMMNGVGNSAWGLSLVSLGAFAGGILAVLIVYRLASGSTGTSVATMLLAGIAITFLAGSISSVFEFIADSEMLRRISLWRMGGLDGADYIRASAILCACVLITVALFREFPALNALLLGESEARHLGVDVDRLKTKVIVCVAAGVGVCVAVAGTISFVGLVVPHMVRILVGPNHRFLMPLSACAGAVLMLIADVFARVIIAPTELPVGLITAAIGAPLFILLLRHRHHYGMQ